MTGKCGTVLLVAKVLAVVDVGAVAADAVA
jgi:hypothetical protein